MLCLLITITKPIFLQLYLIQQKASIILNNTYDLKPHEASQVLGSMDTDFFIDYVNEHTDFFSKNGFLFKVWLDIFL